MNERIDKLLAFHHAAPKDDFAPYALAQEYLKLGRVDEALEWIATTLAIRPDHAYAFYQKARALSEAGRDDEARVAIEEGILAARRSGDAKAESELGELRDTL